MCVCVCVCVLDDHSRGLPECSLLNSYYAKV